MTSLIFKQILHIDSYFLPLLRGHFSHHVYICELRHFYCLRTTIKKFRQTLISYSLQQFGSRILVTKASLLALAVYSEDVVSFLADWYLVVVIEDHVLLSCLVGSFVIFNHIFVLRS